MPGNLSVELDFPGTAKRKRAEEERKLSEERRRQFESVYLDRLLYGGHDTADIERLKQNYVTSGSIPSELPTGLRVEKEITPAREKPLPLGVEGPQERLPPVFGMVPETRAVKLATKMGTQKGQFNPESLAAAMSGDMEKLAILHPDGIPNDVAKIAFQATKNNAQKEPNSIDSILAQRVSRGEMTLEDAMALKKRGTPGPADAAKMLPANTVLALNEGKNVARIMPDVEKAIKSFSGKYGPVTGPLSSMNPYDTGAQTFDARMRSASQAFGRFMEGGVLRKEDEEKYKKMFPQIKDTDDVKKNKLEIVRQMLIQKYEDDRQTLGRSGYDISGFEKLDIPASIFDKPVSGTGPSVREESSFDPDVIAYAEKYGITPEEAMEIKRQRTGGQ